jgi:hypothetical protein
MKRLKQLGGLIAAGLSLFPIQALAHGTESEHKRELMTNIYILIGTGILFVLFLILHFVVKNKTNRLTNVKKQEDREKRQQLSKTAKVFKWAWILSLLAFITTGAVSFSSNISKGITLIHIHGLGYSSDGQRIMIPAHDGIKVYSQGYWSDGEGEKHDYMGFSAVDNGFYSSGHPADGSNKKNPFGLVKSSDEGKSVETLALYGEYDFHLMSASYKKHTIYAIDPIRMSGSNTTFSSGGLYYTKDEGKTWVKTEMKGVNGESVSLAAHPSNDAVVAVGTSNGIYLSMNYGQSFEALLPGTQVTSLFFNDQGALYIGGYKEGASLLQLDMSTKKTIEIKIPALNKDAIQYFAQNPVNNKELVFSTFNKDIYLSGDDGQGWTKIADQGKTISQ